MKLMNRSTRLRIAACFTLSIPACCMLFIEAFNGDFGLAAFWGMCFAILWTGTGRSL